MIGGQDIIIRTHLEPAMALDLCVRAVMRKWPDAVYQDAASGNVFRHYRALSFNRLSELLVYKDADAWKSWERLGADRANGNTMIHLLSCEGELTLVVDDAHAAEMHALIATLRELYRMDILNIAA